MPTIEFHGFPATVRRKIVQKLRSVPVKGMFVFSDCRNRPQTLNGKSAPFIRIYSRFPPNMQKIRIALKGKYDIEFVRIKFWPKGTTRR